MKELYTEGLANHGGHESCAGDRKVVREALTVVCAGWVLSLENQQTRVPTQLIDAEGHIGYVDKARCNRTLRGRRPHTCTETPYTGIGISCARLWSDRTRVRVANPKGTRQQ
jgi:hypothetical protein